MFVSRLHRQMAVWRGGHAAQETIIQFLCTVAWGAAVKHVPCHQQHIDVFALNESGQPVQECFELLVPLAAIKGTADVPVGCVQKLHGFPFRIVFPVNPALTLIMVALHTSLNVKKKNRNRHCVVVTNLGSIHLESY